MTAPQATAEHGNPMSALPNEGDVFDEKYTIGPVLGIGGWPRCWRRNTSASTRWSLSKSFCRSAAMTQRWSSVSFKKARRRARSGASTWSACSTSESPLVGPIIVMEYLRGQDLSALLRKEGPLPLCTTVNLLLQATEAIGEGHALGIIHRDLKPANLFLTHRTDGAPCLKVLDFGISKMPRSPLGTTGGSAPTLPSVVMGSPQYMSPEQMMSAGRPISAPISGPSARPYTSSYRPIALTARLPPWSVRACSRARPCRCSSFVRNLPPEMEAIISCCLQKDRRGAMATWRSSLARSLLSAARRSGLRGVDRPRRRGEVVDAAPEARPPC